MAMLAFRRWSSGLTLSSPQAVPSLDVVWPYLTGIAALLVLAMVLQGPVLALKQLVDFPGHLALVRLASQRVWRGAARRRGHHRDRSGLDGKSDPWLSG